MGQHVCHQRTVFGVLNRKPAIRVVLAVEGRAPYPEGYLHLVTGQTVVCLCRVQAPPDRLVVEDLLAVVGHIDDDGILIHELLGDDGHHRVVVE